MKDALLTNINNGCANKDFNTILKLCKDYNSPYFGMFVSTALLRQNIGKDVGNEGLVKYHQHFTNVIGNNIVDKSVKLLCNWTDNLESNWEKMLPPDSDITLKDDANYWIIINRPPVDAYYLPERTIVFQMEPNMRTNERLWGEWANPPKDRFLKVFTHDTDYNNMEWHLSKTYSELDTMSIEKQYTISTVLSDKYYDPGHILRVDFVKYLDSATEIEIHVFGNNAFQYNHFQKSLPYGEKDDAMFPYKYHFNAENHSIPNYFTEKITDAIMAECLCFYWGCPNIATYINPNAYIVLDLEDFKGSALIVKNAIENDEWSKRIHIIREEKHRLLREHNMFNRILPYI